MNKRMVSILLTLGMAATVFVGCGASSEQTTTPDTNKEEVSTATEEEKEEVKEEDKTIVYWSMWSEGEPQAQVIKAVAEQYTADTGVNVDLQFKGRDGIRNGLEPALQANQEIDMFDESLDRVNMDWGEYCYNLEELGSDYIANHALDALVNISRSYHETGELHAVPYQPTTFGYFYNKTLFDQAGVDGPPQTWEELDAAAEKLLAIGVAPITMDDAYATSNIGTHLARQLGEEGVVKLVNNDGVKWDDKEVVEAIKMYEDFQKKGYFSEMINVNQYPAGQNQEFAPGQAAIVLNGAWLPNETKNFLAADFEWGYFNYPNLPNGVDDNTANNLTSQAFGINKNSDIPEETFEFIKYITTGEFDKMMVEQALTIPADKQNTEWPDALAAIKGPLEATTKSYMWAAGAEMNTDVVPALKENTIRLMSGTMSADEFIAAMKTATEQ